MFNYGYSAPGKRSTRCRHVRLVRPRARTHRTWQDGQGHSYLDLPLYRDLGTRQSLQAAATTQIAQARQG